MRDITVKGKTLKRELLLFFFLFVIVFCFNVYAIVDYKAPWTEIISELHYVLLISFTVYLIIGIIRLIVLAIKTLLNKT